MILPLADHQHKYRRRSSDRPRIPRSLSTRHLFRALFDPARSPTLAANCMYFISTFASNTTTASPVLCRSPSSTMRACRRTSCRRWDGRRPRSHINNSQLAAGEDAQTRPTHAQRGGAHHHGATDADHVSGRLAAAADHTHARRTRGAAAGDPARMRRAIRARVCASLRRAIKNRAKVNKELSKEQLQALVKRLTR